jgi:hypothetical protein
MTRIQAIKAISERLASDEVIVTVTTSRRDVRCEVLQALALAEIAHQLEAIQTLLSTGLTKGSPLISAIDNLGKEVI